MKRLFSLLAVVLVLGLLGTACAPAPAQAPSAPADTAPETAAQPEEPIVEEEPAAEAPAAETTEPAAEGPQGTLRVALTTFPNALDIPAAADRLGIPEGTVKSRLFNVRKRIAEEWNNLERKME